MTKRNQQQSLIPGAAPSALWPWLTFFILLLCIILAHRFFFGDPAKLLGGPPPRNEYIHYMQKKKNPETTIPKATKPLNQEKAVKD